MRRGRFVVHPGFYLLAAAVYFLSGAEVLAALLLGALVHELCHGVAVLLCGGRIRRITLGLTGAAMDISGNLSYGRDICTSAAGPLGSLIAAALSAKLAVSCGYAWLYVFSGVSFVLGVLNLMPVYPLDGGRILYSAAAWARGPYSAFSLSRTVSSVFVFLLLILAAAACFSGIFSFPLVTAALWLVFTYCKYFGNSIKLSR